MKLSMPLIYAGNPRESADQVADLEKAGLDTVWVAEPYGFDAPTLMGYLAAKTETVEIGAGILNIYSRTPGALLQTAAGLDNVSGGRAVLGLGASGPQVIEGFHGIPYDKPLARTREIIEICRMGLRREALEPRRRSTAPAPRRPGHRPRQAAQAAQPARARRRSRSGSPPSATRTSQMTAEVADGWLPFLFHPEKAHEVWGDALAAGRRQAPRRARAAGDLGRRHGRDRRGRRRGCSTSCARCTPSTSAAWALAARTSTTTSPASTATRRRPRRSRTSTSTATSATPRRKVPLEWLEAGNLVGPASYVQERIAAFSEAGVTNLQVTPASDDPAATIAQVKEWVS